jgi:hypothetical protein
MTDGALGKRRVTAMIRGRIPGIDTEHKVYPNQTLALIGSTPGSGQVLAQVEIFRHVLLFNQGELATRTSAIE